MATILIIGEQPTNREYLGTLLGYEGHRLLQAADAAVGLAVAKAERPDLVIAQVLMPAMDGYEFVRQLRADPAIASVPVIFYTAHYHEREAQALAQACGVFHVLAKPCEPEVVLRTVAAALDVSPMPAPPLAEEFDRDHLRSLTHKLSQADEELKRHQVILQTIFDHIPVMINFIDAAGRVQLVNRHWERVLGWSFEEAQARDLFPECYPDPGDRERVMEYILHPPPGWTDFKMRVRDGRTLDTSWSLIVLPDGTRIGIGQDVTERKQAEQALEKYAAGLQALSHRLVAVQEEERLRLARELHDEIGQILATINFQLHAAKGLAGAAALPRLEECGMLLLQVGEQVRSLALELRPTTLDTLGLEATLRWLAEHHQQRTGCAVQVVGHLSGAPLSPDLATACIRVAQEALTNVVRHTSAQHVRIELSQSDSELELVVHDDGVGFDVAATQEQAARRGRLGLLGMAERTQLLGGSLDVESEPGSGTRIRATFPLNLVAEPEE